MHYRHIKKLLRAPRPLTPLEFWRLWKPVSMADGASFNMLLEMTDKLEARAIRVQFPTDVDRYSYNTDIIINPRSLNPIIWFVMRHVVELDYAIGVDLNKLVEILIKLKARGMVSVGAVTETRIYYYYTEHLKWLLEQKGVKYAKSTFRFPSMYSYEYKLARCEMTRLIALFINIKSKQFNKLSLCKNRLTRK